jgi:hypothetical protein
VSEEEPHQRTLFSRFTITVDSFVLKIEKTDYASCPDFAELYKYISDENDRLGSENAEKRKKQKNGEPVNRAKLREKQRQEKKTSLHSRFTVSQFFIDEYNELLYNVSQTGKETLCAPQVKREHGETLRYELFVELHDTPLMEHRGTAATTFALRARFFWPKLKNDVQKFVSACTKCQTNKINQKKNLPGEFKSYINQPD